MQYVTDLNGQQLEVADIATSLAQVVIFLTDVELVCAMTAQELQYYADLHKKLLQLQSAAGEA